MAERSFSHILEEKSKRAFEHIIPPEWVIRPQVPDYGLDLQVQIFDAEQHATPFFFYVQLKATEKISEGKAVPSCSFDARRLCHYVKYPFPIMLVLYCSEQDALFYEWVHPLYHSLSDEEVRRWHLQRTVTVQFSQRLDGVNPAQIDREVRHQSFHLGHPAEPRSPFSLLLLIDYNHELKAELFRQLSEWLSLDSSFDFIRLKETGEGDARIQLNSTPPSLTLLYADKTLTLPLGSRLGDENIFEELLPLLGLSIAVLLAFGGRSDQAIDLVARVINEDLKLSESCQSILAQPSLASLFGTTNRSAEAMIFAEALLKRGHRDSALVLATAVFHTTSNKKYFSQQYRQFLAAALATATTPQEKASLHYDLANSLRFDGYHREAIKQFHCAARQDPTYRNRAYWWAELGGSLFLVNKLRWSEQCYRRSLELGEDRLPARGLLADVLLHQGRFQEAKAEFEVYLKEVAYPVPEFFLKYWLSSMLSDKFGHVTTRNHDLACELVDEALSASNSNEVVTKLSKAIQADPLCGLAWFNLGVCQSTMGQNSKYETWLATALMQMWDVEAWANAIILLTLGREQPNAELMAAAVVEGFDQHGQLLEQQIRQSLGSQLNGSMREEFLHNLREIATTMAAAYKLDVPITYRYFE